MVFCRLIGEAELGIWRVRGSWKQTWLEGGRL